MGTILVTTPASSYTVLLPHKSQPIYGGGMMLSSFHTEGNWGTEGGHDFPQGHTGEPARRDVPLADTKSVPMTPDQNAFNKSRFLALLCP